MKIKKILLFAAIAIYAIQLIFKWNHIYLPKYINSYLADLLCLPILLSLSEWTIQRIKKIPDFILNWKMILFTCVYVSIVFEYLLPVYSRRYTGDPWDVVAYFAGGVLFFIFQLSFAKKLSVEVPSRLKP